MSSHSNSVLLTVVIFSVNVIIYTLNLSTSSAFDQDKENTYNGSRASDTLKLLVVISRHGNRGPLFDLPYSPYPVNDTKYWPYGIEQLTAVGRNQMYKLGVKIYSLYNGFLNPMFYDKDIYASSTTKNRALLSGEAFLAGLYPSAGFQPNKELLQQSVVIHPNSPDKSQVMIGCPMYLQELVAAAKSYVTDNYSNLTVVLSYLYVHGVTGSSVTSVMDLYASWDTFTTTKREGYILPEWTKDVYPQPMDDLIGRLYYSYFASTDTIIRLVMDEVLSVMKSVVNGTLTPDRKMYFYSGHDISLVTLQAILGIPQTSMITLVASGSGMVLELHQDPSTEEFSIQVLYIDGSSPDLKLTPLVIPGCGSSCSFDQLLNITQKFRNVSFEKECQHNSSLEKNTIDTIYHG
ncbi:lysosomal acid phosphatase-like isoform X2 [Homalodisca vitripennis]|uniref:lysosomal acid phosphatase-like isoform X2 n=1 Tax=Homalodisca vitripennis TaxID=197043 RepID=UPI001EECC78E|nr:lysosomal acid phosphatase-like isoform X2 [Homalodisca vitripennis]